LDWKIYVLEKNICGIQRSTFLIDQNCKVL